LLGPADIIQALSQLRNAAAGAPVKYLSISAEFHTPLISLEEFYTQQCLQLPNRLRQGRLTDGENIGGKDDLSQSRYFQKAVQVSELQALVKNIVLIHGLVCWPGWGENSTNITIWLCLSVVNSVYLLPR
jgi:hypothetical protein